MNSIPETNTQIMQTINLQSSGLMKHELSPRNKHSDNVDKHDAKALVAISVAGYSDHEKAKKKRRKKKRRRSKKKKDNNESKGH